LPADRPRRPPGNDHSAGKGDRRATNDHVCLPTGRVDRPATTTRQENVIATPTGG
jgi:hypothetical protein